MLSAILLLSLLIGDLSLRHPISLMEHKRIEPVAQVIPG